MAAVVIMVLAMSSAVMCFGSVELRVNVVIMLVNVLVDAMVMFCGWSFSVR